MQVVEIPLNLAFLQFFLLDHVGATITPGSKIIRICVYQSSRISYTIPTPPARPAAVADTTLFFAGVVCVVVIWYDMTWLGLISWYKYVAVPPLLFLEKSQG